MYQYYPMHYSRFGLDDMLTVFVSVGLLALAGVLVHQLLNGSKKKGPTEDVSDAMSVLRQRYARGEIGTDEYHERKKVLSE